MKISAIIIAKDEEEMIADCLDSLSFCDEIVVINNSSRDRTAEIAGKLGAKVFDCDLNDFSKLRDFGLKKISGDLVLYVDADERVDEELKNEIQKVLKGSKRMSAYKVTRKNFYLGNHEWPKTERMERLFDGKKLKGWKGELHETPIFEGEIGDLSGFLLHYTHRNLSQMLKKTIEWSGIEAKLRYDAGHPKMSWWRFPRVMFSTFFDYYVRQKGYKVGVAGLIESMYQSFSTFITYARLWELQRKS